MFRGEMAHGSIVLLMPCHFFLQSHEFHDHFLGEENWHLMRMVLILLHKHGYMEAVEEEILQ
jgi:hypothetical protein